MSAHNLALVLRSRAAKIREKDPESALLMISAASRFEKEKNWTPERVSQAALDLIRILSIGSDLLD